MSNEHTIKLNKYKLNHLFKYIRRLNGGKNLIARKLGISNVTLDEYLKSGKDLLEQNADKLEPIYELDIDAIEESLEEKKSSYIDEFLQEMDFATISDKNRNAFDVYFYDKREKIKEEYIYKFQKEIIENIKWSNDEKENNKIILLMLFVLIYERGQLSLDEELLYLKNKYSKSSSKHVSFLIKDLERRNKEDFGEKVETQEKKQITVNQQFNNFTHFSIEMDKQLKKLQTNQDTNTIDVKPITNDD